MKNTVLALSAILLLSFTTAAQITVDGQVDISINFPVPEVVIAAEDPVPNRIPKPQPEIIVIKDKPIHKPIYYPETKNAQGTIMNQNGPFEGRIDYQVVSTNLHALSQGEELSFTLDSGDVLSMVIYTVKTNDYNYHYCNQCNGHNNAIVDVKFNGYPIAMRNASLSLQPNNHHYTAVINLHSLDEGDFNGTVHF